MKVTYTAKVTYKNGTKYVYVGLSKKNIVTLIASQFQDGIIRPETVKITTNRKGR